MAEFSDDRQSRYRLWRIWDSSKPCVLFVMLNPSTADAAKDDPTIKIIIQHATAWGFGGIYVGNLYALCCSSSLMARQIIDPYLRDPVNEAHIKEMAQICSKVVYAWGTKGPLGKKQKEPEWLRDIVASTTGTTAYCIETTKKDRIPKHPKQRSHYTMEIQNEPRVFYTG